MSNSIDIVVNGRACTVPAGLTVEQLLGHLEIDPSRVAVELDGAIARRTDWPASEVRAGSNVEVVWFVGGG